MELKTYRNQFRESIPHDLQSFLLFINSLYFSWYFLVTVWVCLCVCVSFFGKQISLTALCLYSQYQYHSLSFFLFFSFFGSERTNQRRLFALSHRQKWKFYERFWINNETLVKWFERKFLDWFWRSVNFNFHLTLISIRGIPILNIFYWM